MPDKTVIISIPIPSVGTPTNRYTAEDAVIKPYDLGVPTPTIGHTDRYTAESPESINEGDHQIPIPTVTLTEAYITESGYLAEYDDQIPIPTILDAENRYTAETPVSDSIEHEIDKPTIAIITRYTAVSPVAIDGGEHQIMIPTISDPETTLYIYSPIDTFLAYDAPNYTDETTEANNLTANDVHLFPAGTPNAMDGFLIGMEHPYWDRIRIDIGTAGVGTWVLEWLYWNGTDWVGVTGLDDNTNSLKTSGRNDVLFDQPTLWGLTTISGAERYWIFCRILTIDAVTTRPIGTKIWAGVIASRLLNTRQTMNEQIGINYMTMLDNTPVVLKKGVGFTWQFKLVDYRDNASQRSLLNPSVYYAKDGVAFTPLGVAFSEIQHGWYSIAVSDLIADCNRLVMRAIAPGAAQCDLIIDFVV